MLNRTGLIFCSAALVVAGLVFVVGFKAAALPRATLDAASVAVAPEALPELQLPDFGTVSVTDLMNHYIDNPPAPAAAGSAPAAVRRFGGC